MKIVAPVLTLVALSALPQSDEVEQILSKYDDIDVNGGPKVQRRAEAGGRRKSEALMA